MNRIQWPALACSFFSIAIILFAVEKMGGFLRIDASEGPKPHVRFTEPTPSEQYRPFRSIKNQFKKDFLSKTSANLNMITDVAQQGKGAPDLIAFLLYSRNSTTIPDISHLDFDSSASLFRGMASAISRMAPALLARAGFSDFTGPGKNAPNIVVFSLVADDSKELAQLMTDIGFYYSQQSKPLFVAVAYGASAATFAQATHAIAQEYAADTIIMFQPPIYEWYWSVSRTYEAQLQHQPRNFNHLYNLYTQAAMPVSLYERYTYPDRKLRQQPHYTANEVEMPVRNVRLVKIDKYQQLADFGAESGGGTSKALDFNQKAFIAALPALIHAVDQYMVNFDFIALVLDEINVPESHNVQERELPISPVIVVINRMISLTPEKRLMVQYGSSASQQYVLLESVTDNMLESVTQDFSLDVQRSRLALDRLFRTSGLDSTKSRIQSDHEQALESPLYNTRYLAKRFAAQRAARTMLPHDG